MNVLLIWPHIPNAVLNHQMSCCEPLALEYVAGALKSFHDVMIHDLRFDGPLEGLVNLEDFHVVGIAAPYTNSMVAVSRISHQVRRLWPESVIVLGGHHPTVSREWLEQIDVDYVIVGEGGLTLLELVNRLDLKKPLHHIPGLASLDKFLKGIKYPIPDSLNQIPPPDRSLLKRHHQRYFHSVYRPVSLIRFSAGCPYKCNFCCLWRTTNNRYLTKDISRIIDELESIPCHNIYVVDDEAFLDSQRMKFLAQAIKETKLKKSFHMYVRPDTVLHCPEVIENWAEIGLDSVLMGAESMEPKELNGYNKILKPDDTRNAINLLHHLNIKVRANFIVQQTYTLENFKQLAHVVQELKVDLPSFAVLTPLPGTLLFESSRQFFISDNPDLFDCYHTLLETQLPLPQFYDAFAGLLESAASWKKTDQINNGRNDSPLFYYSKDHVFQKMVGMIRNGYQWSEISWNRIKEEQIERIYNKQKSGQCYES